MDITLLLAVLLALSPAAVSWWTGRQMLRHADDPALPELLLARQQRVVGVIGVAVGVLFVVCTRHAAWASLVLVVALLVGAYPMRRSLFGESWGMGAYLWYSARSAIGGFGFWLLLAYAPWLVLKLPLAYRAPGAVAIGVVLVLWQFWYQWVWLRSRGATPLEREDLRGRFDDVVQRSGVHPPRLFRFGAPGARIINAVALPADRRSAVAFSDSLLELLEPEEIVAIFAHEVAHLEHFNRRRLRRAHAAGFLLAVAAAGLPLLVLRFAPDVAHVLPWLWPLVVVVALSVRVSRSKAHETESDLRAATLAGDAEALVQGLTKVHVHARLPRRWPAEAERGASHPSLAHRIQAIRNAAGAGSTPAAPFDAPALLESATPGVYVILDAARAHWFEGVPALPAGTAPELATLREHASSYRALSYGDLAELRIAAAGAGRSLVATDRAGHSWSVPLRAGDVAAVQRALDLVDVRLGRGEARTDLRTAARLVALVLSLVILLGGELGVVLVPLIFALVRPGAAALAALGAVAAGRALLGLTETKVPSVLATQRYALVAMALLGVAALWLAARWARRRTGRAPESAAARGTSAPVVVALAATAVALLAVVVWMTSRGSLDWESVQPVLTALALTTLGAGAALATVPRRAPRWGGAAAAAAALALGAAARFGEGILSGTPAVEWADARASVRGRVTIGGAVRALRLSPSAAHFAVQGRATSHHVADVASADPEHEYDEEEVDVTSSWSFTVGSFAGARRQTEALDVAFADERQLVALALASDSALEIRAEPVDSGAATWRDTLPMLFGAHLAVDRATRGWTVSGRDPQTNDLVVFGGTVGADTFSTRRFPADVAQSGHAIAFRSGGVVVPAIAMRSVAPTPLMLLGFQPYRWNVWHFAGGGKRLLGTLPGVPTCGDPGEDDAVICAVWGGKRQSVWRLSERGAVSAVTSLPLAYGVTGVGPDGRYAAVVRADELFVIDTRARRGLRVTLPPGAGFPSEVKAAGDHVATLRMDAGVTTITLYGTT